MSLNAERKAEMVQSLKKDYIVLTEIGLKWLQIPVRICTF